MEWYLQGLEIVSKPPSAGFTNSVPTVSYQIMHVSEAVPGRKL